MAKNPIVANIHAMSINSKPITTIVSMAPIQSNVPAVANEASPDFCASKLKVLFRCKAARM